MTTLREAALQCLLLTDPNAKATACLELDPSAAVDASQALTAFGQIPGRSNRPALVPPGEVVQRSVHTLEGRAALIHALAHIELNAVNLACDIIWRFSGMPVEFYRQWAQVAREEALHFSLLRDHLNSMGYGYGDFTAHNALWEMAEKTKDDILARLALVPRTLEARGLDASPPIKAKLVKAGDLRGGEILDIILRDEIGHVAVGNRWYRYVCEQRGLDPVGTYEVLAERYKAPRLRGPFNFEARLAAGFAQEELDALK